MNKIVRFMDKTSVLKILDPQENKEGQKHKTDRIVIELNE